jgi:hypothetical protein
LIGEGDKGGEVDSTIIFYCLFPPTTLYGRGVEANN